MPYKFNIDQRTSITLNEEDLSSLDAVSPSESELHLVHAQTGHKITLESCDVIGKTVRLRHKGTIYTVQVQDQTDQMVESLGLNKVSAKQVGDIQAPMPGKVLEILVEAGQEIEENTPLVILEAMKMENVLKSQAGGTVESIHTTAGTTVDKGQLLISIK